MTRQYQTRSYIYKSVSVFSKFQILHFTFQII